jgi:cyclophilin family peptidyl-prolyl cis-trans isomerase
LGQLSGANPLVRFHTDLGDMDVVLLQDVAPNTVANFVHYVIGSRYDNTFIHRSPPQFIIQGGGYRFVNGQATPIVADPPVVNEFHVSNKRGTLAMAKLANNPNSATNQWFFNESDANAGNPANLDTQNGGFTVFGRMIDSSSLATMDKTAAVPIFNAGSPFDQLPLRNYVSGAIQDPNLVHVIWIKIVPQIVALTRTAPNAIHVQARGQAFGAYNLQIASGPAGSAFTSSVTVVADSLGNISYNDSTPGTPKFYRLTIA